MGKQPRCTLTLNLGRFVLKKGSYFWMDENESLDEGYKATRKKILESGKVNKKTSKLKVDISFKSMSKCLGVISGKTYPGSKYWKDSNGKTYGECFKLD